MTAEERTQFTGMQNNIEKLSEDLDEVKGLMYQVRESIMGNPLSNDGGIAGRLKKLEEKVELFEKLKWVIIGLAASGGFTISELISKLIHL